MRKVTSFIIALLGLFAVASAQLPLKVIADKYLMQAGQLLEKQDYEAALNLVEKILALQKEHNLTLSDNLYFKDAVAQLLEKKDYITALNIMDRFIALQKEHSLTLPDEFHFQYAQAAFFKYEQIPASANSIRITLELLNVILSEKRKGEFYNEALALLIKAEEKLEELEFSPDRTCAGKPVESSCWMALTNHPECYAWNPYLYEGETTTWTGARSGGLAEGEGTLTVNIPAYGDTIIVEETGHLQNGRKHGEWAKHHSDGSVEEFPYVNGILHGYYVHRNSDGVLREEGPYGERRAARRMGHCRIRRKNMDNDLCTRRKAMAG